MVIFVGVLGCTGMVGQRFLQLLERHPVFRVVALGASDRSAGKPYEEAVRWTQATPIPVAVRKMTVRLCDPSEEDFRRCSLVFSGLASTVAGPVEEAFAAAGIAVFSNAKNHRMDEDVPILLPQVNPEHIEVVPYQQQRRSWQGGFIVTNANCSTTGLATVLKPIDEAFGVKKCFVTTLQAISGAGYNGVSGMEILDNVIPFISSEEDKLKTEPLKILGKLSIGDADGGGAAVGQTRFVSTDLKVSAHCNRVAVVDGHTECVSLKLKKKATPEEVVAVLQNYVHPWQGLLLSAPKQPIQVFTQQVNRPQPKLDRDLGGGYTVSVGRVRECSLFDIKLVLLSHNTILGAAGGSILNAELALAKGYLPSPQSK
ncbi:aspartate-semialdehyde dehydrogenase [Balamuthia mandrillaris]